MPDMLTIREAVKRAKHEGLPITEYTLRHWVRSGAVPARKIGQKALIYYPNLVRFIQCEESCDNEPATVAVMPGIRRVSV